MATAWSFAGPSGPAWPRHPILCTFASAQLAAGEKCQAPLRKGLGTRSTTQCLRLLHHLPENLAYTDLVPTCKALRKLTLTNDIAL